MAPLQDTWYLEITLHLIHGSLGEDSSTFLSIFSLSRSNATFDTGLSTMLFLPAWSILPILNLTLHTNPFSSQPLLMVFASCKITISPAFKLPLVFVHFFFFLKWLQEFVLPATPEFIRYVLNPPPYSATVWIRFRRIFWRWQDYLWLKSKIVLPSPGDFKMVKRMRWRQGQTTDQITNVVSCQRSGIQDSLCLCH